MNVQCHREQLCRPEVCFQSNLLAIKVRARDSDLKTSSANFSTVCFLSILNSMLDQTNKNNCNRTKQISKSHYDNKFCCKNLCGFLYEEATRLLCISALVIAIHSGALSAQTNLNWCK